MKENEPEFWTCRHFSSLIHRQWEGETFVFNPLTGHTHILNQASWSILSACAQRPQSSASLLHILKGLQEDCHETELDQSLHVNVDHLTQLELLEQLGVDAD